MIVGPTMSGKSMVNSILKESYTQLAEELGKELGNEDKNLHPQF